MTKAVVLLFLLDSLPAPVLQVIGKKLNLTTDSVENLQHIDLPTRYQSHKFQEISPESVNNVGFQVNSIQESNEFSIEKRPNFVEHVYSEDANINKDLVESIAVLKNIAKNVSEAGSAKKSNFTKHNYFLNASKNEANLDSMVLKSNVTNEDLQRAPFLVAIFETVGNVTAQTCGGVVVSARWVLTAASCVNVLGPFYSNSSNETTDNYYSIVAGAKDPLKDGTVHQVSKIYLHPTKNNSRIKNWYKTMDDAGTHAPSLALLKVEPDIKGGFIGMGIETWGGDARIYGWALRQNQTGFEMSAISSPVSRLSPTECLKMYGVEDNDSTMCLSVNETASNHTRMNSGCPVVVLRQGRASLLAVALSDGMRPLLASSLSAHRDWLLKLLIN